VAAGLQLALAVAALVYRKPFMRIFGQVASPRLAMSHVSHPGKAQLTHRGMDWVAGQIHRRWGGGAPRTSVSGGTAAATAARASRSRATAGGQLTPSTVGRMSPAGAALLAVEAGKLGVRAAARATHSLQRQSGHFVMGPSSTPPRPAFRSAPKRSYPLWVPATPAATPSSGSDGGEDAKELRRQSPLRQPKRRPAGRQRTYVHHGSGETVTVTSSKIVLPSSWREVKKS
jgi:hypothetical protein